MGRAAIAKRNGSRFILDTNGAALEIAIKEGVYLIKPNLKESGLLVCISSIDRDSAKTEALKIIQANKCEVVVVSLGAAGALLVTKDISQHIPSPQAKKIGTVGAGDSIEA